MVDLKQLGQWLDANIPHGAVARVAPIEDHRHTLFPEESETQVRAVERRQKEFSTGRYLARDALLALGVPKAPILIGERRQPIWPDGIRAALTHSQNICAVVAARSPTVRALGLDLEGATGVSDDVARYVSTPEELARNAGQLPSDALKAAVFSIRETIFKAYYPETGVYLNFADVTLDLDGEHGSFVAHMTNDSCPSLFDQRRFEGKFMVNEDLVMSLLAL